jgi:glycosyltransferase involved in cell wall biosynthesis
MAAPKVSIGIPTYNRSAYVVRAIESVLRQSYPNVEVVVSDNASPDDTAARVSALADHRIVFMRQPQNLGMTGNFNACLQAATGEFFLMLSDDDLLEPTAIQKLSAPFRAQPDSPAPSSVGVVWCPVRILDGSASEKYTTTAGPPQEAGWALAEGVFRGTRGPRFCSVMVRRADAVALGGYHEEHGPICDLGNWTRIASRYPIAVCVPEALAGYTVHQGSISSQPDGALWQRSGERVTADLVALLDQRGERDAARRIHAAGAANISNLLATVMMQYMGKPGWVKFWLSEALRAPRYLFAPVVFQRLLRDGWKLLRLRPRT